MFFKVPFKLPFPRVHQACGVEVQIVVTRLSNNGSYDGYCPACLGIVAGTLFLVPESSGQMELDTV